MKLLYGTANPAKLQYMREVLKGLDLEIIGLNQIDLDINNIEENGNNPLENAKIKALVYYNATKMPVFSCDSGLYIEGLGEENQPGVHVRRVNGKTLNDEQMIEYYTNLAEKMGGKVKAQYKNAICLIIDEKNIFEYDGEDISYKHFYITSKAHIKRNAGFPLDSISVEIESGKYYMDNDSNSISIEGTKKGFREFFERNILKSEK